MMAQSLRSANASRNKVKFDSRTQKPIDDDCDSGVKINGRRISLETQTVQCAICKKDIVVNAGKSLPFTLNGHMRHCMGGGLPSVPENRNDVEKISGPKRLYSHLLQGSDLCFFPGAGGESDGAEGDDEASLGMHVYLIRLITHLCFIV